MKKVSKEELRKRAVYQKAYRDRQREIKQGKKIVTQSELPVNQLTEEVDPHTLLNKSDKAKESLFEKLTETSEAAKISDSVAIKKGNDIELNFSNPQNISHANDQNQTENNVSDNKQSQVEKSSGVGRGKYERKPKLSELPKEETKPPVKMVDPIVTALNGMVVPALAHWKEKDYKDIVLSKDQMKELETVTPENDWMKPSWPAYVIVLCGMYSSNFFSARDSEEKRERKLLEKRTNERADKLEAEMNLMKESIQSRKNPLSIIKQPLTN